MSDAKLPLYQSHKRVRAAKITDVENITGVGAVLVLESANDAWRTHVSWEWLVNRGQSVGVNDESPSSATHVVGGYFVEYADGYTSWSPAEAFEDGYSAAEFVSTSDERTVSNLMRHQYRKLADFEKAQMEQIKDRGLEFVTLLHGLGATDPTGEQQGSRELSLAQTKIEEAVMWAVKHITR